MQQGMSAGGPNQSVSYESNLYAPIETLRVLTNAVEQMTRNLTAKNDQLMHPSQLSPPVPITKDSAEVLPLLSQLNHGLLILDSAVASLNDAISHTLTI